MKRALLVAFAAAFSMHIVMSAQQSGVNIPVLPVIQPDPTQTDPAQPDPVIDAALKGDLYLQRQVEPTIAVSTRNPSHLLTFFNDYRAIYETDFGVGEKSTASGLTAAFRGAAGFLARLIGRHPSKRERHEDGDIPEEATAAEAWVGMSRSYDGGITWTGGFLPGSPNDQSLASTSSPIHDLQAATDPVLSAAPCGKFYLAFLAFTRAGASRMVVARYEDLNDQEGGDRIVYEGMTVLESANNASYGYFLDKPAIAVDINRSGAGGCAHNVYVSYTTFNGNDKNGNFTSKVTFARSTDMGLTFSTQKLNSPFNQNQNTAIAIDPRDSGGGTIYIVWRHFFSPDTILMHKSTNFGATFPGQPKDVLAASGYSMHPFDQPTRSTTTSGTDTAFRVNSVPTATVAPNGKLFVAFAERVAPLTAGGFKPAAGGSPRIMLMSLDPVSATWSPRTAVDVFQRDDPPPQAGLGLLPQTRDSGPQVMPMLSQGGGRVMLVYYESRGFVSGDTFSSADLSPSGFISGIDRVMDLRSALIDPRTGSILVDPVTGKLGTAQVSRYPIRAGAKLEDGEQLSDIAAVNEPCVSGSCVRSVNRVNVPHSAGGTSPFIGDYVGLTPRVQFVPNADQTAWRWAICGPPPSPGCGTDQPADVPYQGFYAAFTDNRNQVPPLGDVSNYQQYPAPGSAFPSCVNPGSRNSDVFTSAINADFVVAAPTTFKQLNVKRAFPIYLYNGTPQSRTLTLGFATTAMADVASFAQFPPVPPNPDIDTLDVVLFPFSSATRVAYLNEGVSIPITVLVTDPACTCEVGRVTVNSAFNILQPDLPPDAYNPQIPGISQPGISQPGISQPGISQPGISQPGISQPGISQPGISQPGISQGAITDVTWTVTNGGNTTASYLSQINIENPTLTSNPDAYAFMLIVSKTSGSGEVGQTNPCLTAPFAHDQIIAVVKNPGISQPGISQPGISQPGISQVGLTDATFYVAPSASSNGSTGGTSPTQSFAAVGGQATTISTGIQDLRAAKAPDTATVTLRIIWKLPDCAPDQPDTPGCLTLAEKNAFKQNLIADPPSAVITSLSCNGNNKDDCPRVVSGIDLTTTSTVTASPTSVLAGDSIQFPAAPWSVKNQGNTPAEGTFTHGIYLSTNATWDPADRLLTLAGTTTGPLAGGAQSAFSARSVSIPTDTAAGSYYLLLVIDDGQQVKETNEHNNVVAVGPITVKVPNAPPVASDQSVSANEDTAKTIALTASDPNSDPLTFTVVTQPAHGFLTGMVPNLTYTPVADYNGPDGFTFKANDGQVYSNTATVSITVIAVNDTPTFIVGSNQTVLEDAGLQTVTGWATAISAGPADEASQTVNFVVSNNNSSLFSVQPKISSDGTLTYTPAPDANGAATVTLQLHDSGGTANGGNDTSAAKAFTITITPVDDPPQANPDRASVTAGGTVTINVLANDIDIDSPHSSLSITSVTQGANGKVAITDTNTTVSYTAGPTFAGIDTFTYSIGTCSTCVATVTVTDGFGFKGLLLPYQQPPKAFNVGSSIPIVWQYTNSSGAVIDSSGVLPILTVTFTKIEFSGATTPNNCQGGTDSTSVLANTDYPGNSNFQYFTAANPHPTAGANTWQFNWQTNPPAVSAGCWNVRVILDLNKNNTNKAVFDSGDQVNGGFSLPASLPFIVKLK